MTVMNTIVNTNFLAQTWNVSSHSPTWGIIKHNFGRNTFPLAVSAICTALASFSVETQIEELPNVLFLNYKTTLRKKG